MVRRLHLFALVLVATATSASAQHVVYSTPVVYPQPAVYHHQRVGFSMSHKPVMNALQAGYLFNRPLLSGPASAHPISSPFWMSPYRDPDNYFGGSPFQNRPFLNIAIGLALR